MAEVTEMLSLARAPAGRVLGFLRAYGTTLLVAAVVFVVGYENGGFGESTRDTFAVALWWVLILAIGCGIWPLVRTPAAAWLTGGLLAAFALFTLLSIAWAADAAGAYSEFTRVTLYVAVFAVAVVASNRDDVGRWCDGLALGIGGLAFIALISRLFPSTFSNRDVIRFLPAGQTRLSFPVGYWNGLAILLAIGIPLLLRTAVAGRTALLRGLALAPIPALAAVIYLTSSRAGVAVAVLAAVVFLALTANRWGASAAIVVGAASSAAVVFALSHRDALVNGPLSSDLAATQGRSAALVVFGACILTGIAYGVGCSLAALRSFRPRPAVGRTLVVALVVLAVAGIAAAHPVRRFHDFKRLPTAQSSASVESHLLSGSGNYRWQLWHSAVREFESRPLIGRGAGSFQAWWLQHGSLPFFVQDAHSLYAETLGEAGIVGFIVLGGAFLTGLAVAVRRTLAARSGDRVLLTALTSAFVAFAAAAAVDWMWELTIVTVVAIACLGLAVGPGTRYPAPPRAVPVDEPPRPKSRAYRYGVGVAVIVGGWLVICAIAIPLLAGARIRDSQSASASGNLKAAIRDALDARSIQPWSSSPYLQLALLDEQAGDFTSARSWLQMAIDRSRDSWELWYLAIRLDTERGAIKQAGRDLARARQLNPRSPLFS